MPRDAPDDSPAVDRPAPANLVVLIGDEELLVARGISTIAAAARRVDPTTEVIERTGSEIDGPELAELLGPSLFGERRVLVIRAAQDLRTASLAGLQPYLSDPADAVTIVLHHAGGAKGKAVLDAARKAGAQQINCAKVTRPEERYDFVRKEVRRAGGTIDADAVAGLVDAVGGDLRELAAVSSQLVSDAGGRIDAATVHAYHRGRAEVTGFAVSDLAVVGEAGRALETLRWALSVGVPHVVIADAMADGVRTVAKVSGAGRGDPFRMAAGLGMPPWKVKRAQGQSRGWTERGLQNALGIVATLNADVKGAAVDPGWALEHAIRRLAAAHSMPA